MGLPSIQPVDEYNVRYGAATKEGAEQRNTQQAAAAHRTFYQEPRKKFRQKLSQVRNGMFLQFKVFFKK